MSDESVCDVTFDKMLRHAAFALDLMPRIAWPVLVFVTDSMVGLPDQHRARLLLQRIVHCGAVCHFVHMANQPLSAVARKPRVRPQAQGPASGFQHVFT